MQLEFKKWVESIFGGRSVDQNEPIPASNAPLALNNKAFPDYNPDDKLPGIRRKKTLYSLLKRQKKN